ncbi:MAG: hypothetical protein F6Q13_16955 [Mycobacterium sp.]|nr:MAG: hypothetical protein F6Q13_16955 [Mycobacterium sp.]
MRPPEFEHGSTHALLVFAWATAAAALAGWLARNPDVRAALIGTFVLLVAAIGYLTLVGAVTGFLAVGLPPATVPPASSLGIVTVTVILGALTLLRQAPPNGWMGRLQRVIYTKALAAGNIAASRSQPMPTTHPLAYQPMGALR